MGQTGSAAERNDSRCSKTCTSCADWGEKDLNTVKINAEHLPALLGAKTCVDHEAQKGLQLNSISQPADQTDSTDLALPKTVALCPEDCCPKTIALLSQLSDMALLPENTDKAEAPASSQGMSKAEKASACVCACECASSEKANSHQSVLSESVNCHEAIIRAQEKLKKQQEHAAAARETEAQLIETQQNEILQRVREELQRVKEEQEQQRELERRESKIKLDEERQMLAEYMRQQKEESERVAEEARQIKEEASERREEVRAWLRKNGFKHANELKRKMLHKVRPLHIAVQRSDVRLVKLLLSAGADVNMADGKNETVVALAKRVNKKENSIKSDAVLRVISEPAPLF
jgi:hypothetical protein